MMLCVYIDVVRVANDYLNCLEVEVGVTLVGASAPSAHYTHIFGVDKLITDNLKVGVMKYKMAQKSQDFSPHIFVPFYFGHYVSVLTKRYDI
jgi:hypothetical protein